MGPREVQDISITRRPRLSGLHYLMRCSSRDVTLKDVFPSALHTDI